MTIVTCLSKYSNPALYFQFKQLMMLQFTTLLWERSLNSIQLVQSARGTTSQLSQAAQIVCQMRPACHLLVSKRGLQIIIIALKVIPQNITHPITHTNGPPE